MRWLLWKDFRLARPIFLLTAALLFVPHAIAIIAACCERSAAFQHLLVNLSDAVVPSVLLGQFPLLMLGGMAMAGERGDRSAEFLASQPVRRSRILLSKFLIVLGLIALIWLPNLILVAVLAPFVSSLHTLVDRTLLALFIPALLGLVCFSVAWLFSSWLESPTFAACAGLILPLTLLTGVVVFWQRYIDSTWNRSPLAWLFGILLLAVASFVGGTVHYLRRVEP